MPTMPRVVFIPGLACDAHLWAAQAASLSRAGWPVAHSDVATREPTLPRMAQALLAEHPGRLVLAGASMGAMVALHAALQAPDRVSALVLVGASARADDTELRRLRADAIAHFEQGDVEPFLRANALLVLHPSRAADPALLEDYLQMVLRAGPAQLVAQNRAVMDRPDLRPRLASLRCPTLLMVGETDAVTPPDHAREIAAAVPGAALHVIERSGHLPTIEAPERVNALLGSWLSALR